MKAITIVTIPTVNPTINCILSLSEVYFLVGVGSM